MPDTAASIPLQTLRDDRCRLDTAHLRLWRMTGAGAASYLQTQLTSDLLALEDGRGQWTTLLDRKGRLRAIAQCWRLGDGFFFLGDAASMAALTEHLEAFHFTEDYTQTPVEDGSLMAVAGPKAALLLTDLLDLKAPLRADGLWAMDAPEHGALLLSGQALGEQVIHCHLADGSPLKAPLEALPVLSPGDTETARVEAGNVMLGVDSDEKTLVPETGLEHIAVSYDKGCYLGQEVVARMKTYGTAPKALMGLTWRNGPALMPGLRLEHGGKFAGAVTSAATSPTFGPIAMAYVKKEWRVPGQQVTFDTAQGPLTVTVTPLPFYQRADHREEAQALYERALDKFAGVSEDESIELLRRAVALYPTFTDAYEALGVILARQQKLDEAIALMHHLSALNPEEVMAQTNLSLYYMKKGLIQEAEDAKARATALQFKAAAKKANQERETRAQQEEERRQMEERMAMFREVLDIDPDDHLANFGLGGALLQQGRAADALPYLQKAVAVNKDHSASYQSLGKALEAAGQTQDAVNIYDQGIAVASRRGDLMPMKDMQLRRAKLAAPQETL